ncbi:MAG: copper amine oxidase N-terminal domain-containing protein [Clostridia bacterium]|nr:copper amine oxidase N-terminal domain-containing protein [Clostridia bacterium]
MKKRNQILALTAAVTVLSASTAMAEYVEGREPVYRGEGVMTTAVSTARDYAVVVNGVQLEKKGYMDGDKVMLPVRAIAEALGFEVTWIGETETVQLTRGANFITLQIGVDGYTFAKTAPMPLGKAPVEIEGTTFVPIDFADEILHTTVTIDPTGTVAITEASEAGEVAPQVSDEGISTAFVSEVGEKSITVETLSGNTVVLNIGEETKLVGKDGEDIKIADLTTGMKVNVVYGEIMTASEPPQNVPVSVRIVEERETETSLAKVLEVDLEAQQIVTGEDIEKPETQVVFNVGDDTKITKDGKDIELKDIKADDNIRVIHSIAMTRSLPPQTAAYEIEVVDAEAGQAPETAELEGTIAEVDAEEGRVTIGDEKDLNAQTILLVSEETEIVDKDGKTLKLEDLKKGMEIKAVHKTMMTMSIPPQTPAVKITVQK